MKRVAMALGFGMLAMTGTTAASAAPCSPGSYSATGEDPCGQVPPGTYQPYAGQTGFYYTSPGYYQPDYGQTGQLVTPPGTFTNSYGAPYPTNAPRGSYVSGAGYAFATEAAPGRYVPGEAQTFDWVCPAGSFSYGGASACRAGSAVAGPDTAGPGFSASPDPVDFGGISLGDSADRSLVIGNLGDIDVVGLHITDLSLLGFALAGDAGDFSLLGLLPSAVIGVGGLANLGLRFTPTATGLRQATLTITTDQFADFGTPGQSFAILLQGSAVPEPASWALLVTGFGLAGIALRRRRTQQPA